jgi:hypothetical protein
MAGILLILMFDLDENIILTMRELSEARVGGET